MRIVGGKYKGRILQIPKNIKARPTTDFAKESLFNILSNYFDFQELEVLDLFGGTGSISFEFASRGVQKVDLIESSYKHILSINKNMEVLQEKNITAHKADVFRFIPGINVQYDIIFADPPYDIQRFDELYRLIMQQEILKKDGWLILEHSSKTKLEDQSRLIQKRNYGSVNFSIFQ